MSGSGFATDFEDTELTVSSLLVQHAKRRRQGMATIDHRTLHENLQYVERVLPADPPPGLSWLLRLLIPRITDEQSGHGVLPSIRTQGDTDTSFSLALMAGLTVLVGFDHVPAVLLLPCEQDSVDGWFRRAPHSLEEILECVRRAIRVQELRMAPHEESP